MKKPVESGAQKNKLRSHIIAFITEDVFITFGEYN
jgi:hypothetical protein